MLNSTVPEIQISHTLTLPPDLQRFANWTGSLSAIERTLVWVWCLIVVAICLGGFLALIDQLLTYGIAWTKERGR
jgi:hypothetical protein